MKGCPSCVTSTRVVPRCTRMGKNWMSGGEGPRATFSNRDASPNPLRRRLFTTRGLRARRGCEIASASDFLLELSTLCFPHYGDERNNAKFCWHPRGRSEKTTRVMPTLPTDGGFCLKDRGTYNGRIFSLVL